MIRVKQATKQGWIEMQDFGIADFAYPASKCRRGRVQGGGGIAPTLTAQSYGGRIIKKMGKKYRIRKLTPSECYRLMGVDEESIKKMREVNSDTQCYKQAGNSIVVDTLACMFQNLNITN